jgi:polysaccharide biosynthesis/export protein
VLGDVNGANKFPINLGGDRVLDVISRAGGIRSASFETYITLQRGGRAATVYLPQLVRNTRENVFVRPGDTVLVVRDQRAFSVFGAVTQSGRYPFDRETITLAEAIAKAGGLADARANPSHVYLYRVEPRKVLEQMGTVLAQFPPHQHTIHTIYQANLKDPAGFFSTQQFQVRNGDVIFVGNADAVEVIKFFNTLTAITQPFAQGASAGFNVRRILQD